jgi:uncharacterized SAM-binding protein YcdF (DUF218 family)
MSISGAQFSRQRPLDPITGFMFIDDPVVEADIILVPGGNFPQAAEKAADLYLAGLSSRILPSGRYHPDLAPYPTEWHYMRDICTGKGVPKSAILREETAENTFENARKSLAVIRQAGIPFSNCILVCRNWHARRSLLTYQAVFPPEVSFRVVSVPDQYCLAPDDWYLDPVKTEFIMTEMRKIGEYFGREIPKLIRP